MDHHAIFTRAGRCASTGIIVQTYMSLCLSVCVCYQYFIVTAPEIELFFCKQVSIDTVEIK